MDAKSTLESRVLDKWLQVLVHPIGLIELYAIGVAFKTWSDILQNEKSIFFCDNWAALDVFVKGSSTEPLWRALLLEIEIIDIETRCLMWMSRVPSASNIADPPSRGSLEELSFLEPICLDTAICPCEHVSLESVVSKAVPPRTKVTEVMKQSFQSYPFEAQRNATSKMEAN